MQHAWYTFIQYDVLVGLKNIPLKNQDDLKTQSTSQTGPLVRSLDSPFQVHNLCTQQGGLTEGEKGRT